MQSILNGQPRIVVKTANGYLTVDGEVAVFQSEDQMRCYLNRLRMHQVRVRCVALCYSIGRCKKCGSPLFQSDLPESGYESQCFTCDEDFYSFEQNCEWFGDKEDSRMMPMTVEDLSRQQLDELKEAYFREEDIEEVLSDSITAPEQIPDDVIYMHYKGACFTDDDFFCSSKENGEGEGMKKKYKILIEETVVQPFFIPADSAEEARRIAADLYSKGKLVVEGGELESANMRIDDESANDYWESIL